MGLEGVFPIHDSLRLDRLPVDGPGRQGHRARFTEMKYRSIPIALFLIILLVPFALRWAAGTSSSSAPGSDTNRLIVISPHAEAIRTEFADAFSAWHQQHYGSAVFVDYRIYGGASDIMRYFE